MFSHLDTVLLPGLDGTGRLFRSFADALPRQISTSVIAYPADELLGYSDLKTRVEGLLPRDRPFSIVAESFSGPIAIRIAATRPKGLVALVLVGSFVRHSIRLAPAWVKPIVGAHLFWCPPPAWLVRRLLAGSDAPDDLVAETFAAWSLVKPGVLAFRVREALSVNVADDFLEIAVPILYLTGTQDRLLVPTTVETLKRLRPDLKIATVDAPHFMLQRRPAEAADVISKFLLHCAAI